METIFKIGMKVYDQIFFPDVDGRIIGIHYESNKILLEVKFFSKYRLDPLCTQSSVYYTEKGYMIGHFGCDCKTPTLSTKPYKVEFQGFEQKAPAPTFEEAWNNSHNSKEIFYSSNCDKVCSGYPTQELADASEALRRLLFLRDYYNEGWQPDWEDEEEKFSIQVCEGEFHTFESIECKRVVSFKTEEIRDKFLEDQRELLEIAKPLL